MTTDTTPGTPSRTGPSRVPAQAARVAGATARAGAGPPPRTGCSLSEWTKLRSLRSTWWTLALAAVIGLGFAVAVAATVGAGDLSADALGADDVALVLGATGVAALVLGVLGALQMSSEYASRSISVSLTAVPGRRALLVAKAAVLVAVVAPLSLAVSAGGAPRR